MNELFLAHIILPPEPSVRRSVLRLDSSLLQTMQTIYERMSGRRCFEVAGVSVHFENDVHVRVEVRRLRAEYAPWFVYLIWNVCYLHCEFLTFEDRTDSRCIDSLLRRQREKLSEKLSESLVSQFLPVDDVIVTDDLSDTFSIYPEYFDRIAGELVSLPNNQLTRDVHHDIAKALQAVRFLECDVSYLTEFAWDQKWLSSVKLGEGVYNDIEEHFHELIFSICNLCHAYFDIDKLRTSNDSEENIKQGTASEIWAMKVSLFRLENLLKNFYSMIVENSNAKQQELSVKHIQLQLTSITRHIRYFQTLSLS